MSKDMGRRLPQLYYIKIKISYDLGFIVFLRTKIFFKKSLKGVCACHNCLNYVKV